MTSSGPLRLMAVHAHPDDESSKGAATMARYVDQGVEVLVVTCTGGERGSILNPALKDRPDIEENIAEIRKQEMARARADPRRASSPGWDSSTRGCPRVIRCPRCRRAASHSFPWTRRWSAWSGR